MKKFLSILLVLALCLTLFAACGGQPSSSEPSSEPSDSSSSEESSEASSEESSEASGEEYVLPEVLTMGTNAAFPPYEYYENEQIVGIDAEVAAAICEKLGCELKISDMDFDAIVPAVVSGKIDFGMAGMTVTEDRLKSVDFSISYATGIQAIIVAEGSPITSVDDLYADGADYQIGVQQGTTGDIYCSDDFGDDHVQRFNKGADAVMALASGKIDCVVIDNEPAKAFVAANEGLVILETSYAVEDYAICLQKDSPLTAKINEALEALIADGTVQKIVDKYIPAE